MQFSNQKGVIDMSENRCICCGAVVPDGRHTCPGCDAKTKNDCLGKDELLERTMEVVCDLCKWPYLETPDYLKDCCDHCENCPAEAAIINALQEMELNVSTVFAKAIADSFREALEGRK